MCLFCGILFVIQQMGRNVDFLGGGPGSFLKKFDGIFMFVGKICAFENWVVLMHLLSLWIALPID